MNLHWISIPELLIFIGSIIGIVVFIFMRIVNDLPDDFLVKIKRMKVKNGSLRDHW
jgi:hypothetical protein